MPASDAAPNAAAAMQLQILPTRTGRAAENMATDFLLLQRYPEDAAGEARFRHYDWSGPAFTFGFGQKIAYVRARLADLAADLDDGAGPRVDLCRRPTGGGVVDHRDDWTYALVIPRGHPLYDARATQSYLVVHRCLATALRALGLPVVLKESCEPAADAAACAPGPTVCFTRPELHDVLHAGTGAKVSGAAQKRTKHGLLFQGSIWKPALGAAAALLDWEAFQDAFCAQLAEALAAEATPTPWPDFSEDVRSGLTEQYSSPEWIDHR